MASASGTFLFSAMLLKGPRLQWMVNDTDPANYGLFQWTTISSIAPLSAMG
jgi:hypothetical protein